MENTLTYTCPSLQECDWTGERADLIKHYADCHNKLYSYSEAFKLYAPIDTNHKNNILLNYYFNAFLLQFSSNVDSGKFWCGVRYIGEIKKAPQFVYEISFRNKSKEKVSAVGLLQLQQGPNWDLDEDLMINFDLNGVKSEERVIKICFNILRKNRCNFNIHKLLINELKCVICRMSVQPPISLCLTGHLICNSCKIKSGKCNSKINQKQCKLKLEDATKLVRYPCKNKAGGCNFVGSQKDIKDHHNNCSVIACLVDKSKCKWMGATYDFHLHLFKNHPESISCYKKVVLLDLDTTPFTFITFIKNTDDSIFKVSCKADYSKLLSTWNCQIVSSVDCKKYKLIIAFMNPGKPEKAKRFKVECCLFKRLSDIKMENESVEIPFYLLKHLVVDNKIMIMYTISNA